MGIACITRTLTAMGFLTSLLILSAGLLAVSGMSPMGGRQRLMLTTKDKQGNARRRQLQSVDDYVAAGGEDYFLGGLVGPAIKDAMPAVIDHFEKALPGLIQRNLPVLLKEGAPILWEHLKQDLPHILDEAIPVIVEEVVPVLPRFGPKSGELFQ